MPPLAPPRPVSADPRVATLLVVDDEAPNRDLLGRRLEHHGFRVILASSGAEALEALAAQSFDLALLDVMMPEMSGLDVLAAVRRSLAWRELPVIMVTAKSDSRDVVEALDLGADDYVTKPLDFPVTLARVRAQLTRAAAERAALALQRHGDLQHAQKLSAVGQLAGGVAHDFNNLLMAIHGHGEFLRDDLPQDDKRQGDVEHILKAAQTAAALTRQLLTLSRVHQTVPQAIDLGAAADSMARLLRRVICEQIELVVTRPKHLWQVLGDAGQLDQVILNLVVNACDAMPQGGRLAIDLENATMARDEQPGGDLVRLTVRDTGCGMDDDTLARAFEPFFTTKAPAHGTGLGLATVRHVVEQLGGTIAVTSAPGAGTTVQVLLPRTEPELEVEVPVLPAGQARTSGTALLAEDDREVRRYVRGVLEREGYTVVEAASGEHALEAAAGLAGGIDLLVTDMVMPGIGGLALCEALHATRPDVPVVFMSGHDASMAPHGGVPPALQKPFSAAAFRAAVRRARASAVAPERAGGPQASGSAADSLVPLAIAD